MRTPAASCGSSSSPTGARVEQPQRDDVDLVAELPIRPPPARRDLDERLAVGPAAVEVEVEVVSPSSGTSEVPEA